MSEINTIEGTLDGVGMHVGVAVAEFNRPVTDGLLEGALGVLEAAQTSIVTVVRVPGAFELPVVAGQLAAAGYDAVVALGAVILGETDHYDHVAHRASEGLMRVGLDHGVPVAFGVLTARTPEHAFARSAPGPDNKGAEAAATALRTASALIGLRRETRELEARERQRSRTV